MLAIEQPAFDDLAESRDADLQFLHGFAKLTAAGGGKQDNLLSGKIMAFQEGIDDRGCYIPYADKRIMPTYTVFIWVCNILTKKYRHYILPLSFLSTVPLLAHIDNLTNLNEDSYPAAVEQNHSSAVFIYFGYDGKVSQKNYCIFVVHIL